MWAASCLASCCAACACDACRTVVSSISRRSARIAYCGLFALSLIVSWILREVAAPLMEKLPWINHFHKTPDREWFETDAVLRVSLGNFVFFSILSVMMIGVKTQKDPRDESMSKFGAGFFLLVQVVLLLDFVHGWNDTWVGYDEQFWYAALLVVSLVCYLATFVFSGLLFHWFTPSEHDCGLNTFFIVMTLIFVFVFAVVVLHPAVGGSILPASVISFYCMYLCYSGLASEPRDYECNGLHKHSKAVSTGTMTIGLLTTVLSVVYSAVRAGSSTTLLSPPDSPRAEKPLLPLDGKAEDKEEKEQKKPVTYSYAFFHIIFSLASMYSAMLLTGWSTSVGESGKLVDVGWPSVWVRVVTSWATAGLFIWSLVAPILFPDRHSYISLPAVVPRRIAPDAAGKIFLVQFVDMKLNVKTLKGSQFEIRVQPTDTIMAVKKNIEDSLSKDNYPCGQQLLIHNGKVLKDETTLVENKVTEEGFLVVMLSKNKTASSAGSSSAQPTSTTTSSTTPAAPSSTQSIAVPASNSTSAQEQPAAQSDTLGEAASTLVSGSNIEQMVQQIMEMGGGSWDKETVTRALRAAYNNPERAVDYLYSGIPERVDVPVTNISGAASGADLAAPPASGGPNSSPLDLFPQEAVSDAGAGDLGTLEFLRSNDQFQQLRSMVNSNPQILQPMLQELGKQNPQLLRLIQENQAEFLQLLNEPYEGSDGEMDIFDQPDQEMSHAVNVTPAEQEAIQRLEAMGFDRALVIEAFLACDRNEELAANYLLENSADFED
ncbi:unnamed protein product [Thlaspi arvense]|uniref:Ubiquitin receptor RAD23 n=1 Tax=Thlaspi arvense TaxID=13288 RepID=A0AAU9RB22_THLAR|nr:unnamed protein product [Thlaspi arvense]